MDRRTFHKLAGMGILGATRAFDSLSGTEALAAETSERVAGEKWESSEKRLGWFREARYGLFVHWGPYSVLGGEWRGMRCPLADQFPPQGPELVEGIMDTFRIPLADYRRDAVQKLNPEEFNARQWVSMVKAAGMKYIVVTSKHQDGFAMWHSKVSKYNIVDATPFKRDPLKELSEACQQEGIRFCVYYSHRDDYEDPNSYANTWDFHARKRDYAKYWEGKAMPQVRELLTGYGPLGLIWFDHGMNNVPQAEEMFKLVRSLQPDCLINSRLLTGAWVGRAWPELLGDYISLGDHGLPDYGIQNYFEAPMTLNKSWGFCKYDDNWKPAGEVIHQLTDCASKGGNYLLDVGATPEGTFPGAAVDILKNVGDWLEQNGESIYGVSASPLGEVPWGRVTSKDGKLYLHVFDWPQDRTLSLKTLNSQIARAYLLADRSQSLTVLRDDEKRQSVRLPDSPSKSGDTVIVLEFAGEISVEPTTMQPDKAGAITLTANDATTTGKALRFYNRRGGVYISKWTGPEDRAEWNIQVDRPSRYQVWVSYAADWPGQIGSKYRVSAGDTKLDATVLDTGAYCFADGLPCTEGYRYGSHSIGIAEFSKAGPYKVKIHPVIDTGHKSLFLRWIELTPLPDANRLQS